MCNDLDITSSDRPNPVSAEPNHFFAELCSAEPNGSAKVRPIWPNLFGRIGRTGSAVFAEHVRPYLPNMLSPDFRTYSANLASLVRFKCGVGQQLHVVTW